MKMIIAGITLLSLISHLSHLNFQVVHMLIYVAYLYRNLLNGYIGILFLKTETHCFEYTIHVD